MAGGFLGAARRGISSLAQSLQLEAFAVDHLAVHPDRNIGAGDALRVREDDLLRHQIRILATMGASFEFETLALQRWVLRSPAGLRFFGRDVDTIAALRIGEPDRLRHRVWIFAAMLER